MLKMPTQQQQLSQNRKNHRNQSVGFMGLSKIIDDVKIVDTSKWILLAGVSDSHSHCPPHRALRKLGENKVPLGCARSLLCEWSTEANALDCLPVRICVEQFSSVYRTPAAVSKITGTFAGTVYPSAGGQSSTLKINPNEGFRPSIPWRIRRRRVKRALLLRWGYACLCAGRASPDGSSVMGWGNREPPVQIVL